MQLNIRNGINNMARVTVSRLLRAGDFKVEIFLTVDDTSDLTALKEAAKFIQREVIIRESGSH